MKDAYTLKCLTVLAITALEAIAMLQGIDGLYFSIVMTIFGGIFGVTFKDEITEFVKKIKKEKGQSKPAGTS